MLTRYLFLGVPVYKDDVKSGAANRKNVRRIAEVQAVRQRQRHRSALTFINLQPQAHTGSETTFGWRERESRIIRPF